MKRDLLKLLQQLLRNSLSQARRRKGSGPLLIAVLTIAVFAVTQFLHEPNSPMPAKGTSLDCQLMDIHDGDTVTARCPQGKLKVRLFGIDAPEIGQKPWGVQSRELLRGLLPRLLNLANFNQHLFMHESCQCKVRPTHQSLLDQCSKVA